MDKRFDRALLLYGEENLEKLKNSRILIVGLGGVGGYVIEGLVRSGISNFTIVDHDKVDITNINRQIIALSSTIGEYKCDLVEKRMKDINPLVNVEKYNIFYSEETKHIIDLSQYDYVVDAIDSIKSKILLINEAYRTGTKIISSMGAGNKIEPSLIQISDLYKTDVDPIAKILRKELKPLGVKKLKVAYSKERPLVNKPVVASSSFIPSIMGLYIASEIIKDITGIKGERGA